MENIVTQLNKTCSEETTQKIYSLGYESLSIDKFFELILNENINTIVDVRNVAFSYKYEFSKHFLKKRCHEIGIEYFHFPEVGIPSKIRKNINNKKALWEIYEKSILPNADKTIDVIEYICLNTSSVLLCYEKDPKDCHRNILAKEISLRTGLLIQHF